MILRLFFALIITSAAIGFIYFSQNVPQIKSTNLKDNQPVEITAAVIAPKPNENPIAPPEISARSAVVLDSKTGTTLFEKDPHLKHLPASTTKMMTALVALESCSIDQVAIIKSVEKSGTQMGLEIGDQITVENLLYGLLMASGNDAAFALANSCSPNYKTFVERMNKKAKELNMNSTNFVNPAGFDNELQYSTALDLARLANAVTANPLISKIVATKSTVVTDTSGTRTYYLENINKLLGAVNGVEGVKTGQTDGALEIVITKTTRNGHTVIISILGSSDRFGESKDLIEWAFANFHWISEGR